MAENYDLVDLDPVEGKAAVQHEEQREETKANQESPAKSQQRPVETLEPLVAPPVPISPYLLYIKDLRVNSIGSVQSKSFLAEAGKAWRQMSAEERQRYTDRALLMKKEYEEYKHQMELRGLGGAEEAGAPVDEHELQQRRKFLTLPLSKIRSIINMDPESGMVSREALFLITKATEAFVEDLGGVCAQIAKTKKRKTLSMEDIQIAATNIDRFHFIKDSRLPALGSMSAAPRGTSAVQGKAPLQIQEEADEDEEVMQELAEALAQDEEDQPMEQE